MSILEDTSEVQTSAPLQKWQKIQFLPTDWAWYCETQQSNGVFAPAPQQRVLITETEVSQKETGMEERTYPTSLGEGRHFHKWL